MFEALTQNIRVQVEPQYIEEQSDPKQNHFFFAYTVRIANEGPVTVQLLARHWIIKDGFGQTEEVEGDGVVGLQPTLHPGEVFEYSSFCPLATPTGSMHGTYLMKNQNGDSMKIEIPMFILSEPNHFH
jgi:ApaG protein